MTTAQFFCSTVDFFIILPKTLKREKKQKLIFPTAAFSSNFSEYPFVYCPCSWWLFIPGAVHEINEWKSVPHRENSGTWTCHHTTVPRNRDYRWVPPISSLREGPDEKLLWIYFLWWRWSVFIMIIVIWFCDTTADRVVRMEVALLCWSPSTCKISILQWQGCVQSQGNAIAQQNSSQPIAHNTARSS